MDDTGIDVLFNWIGRRTPEMLLFLFFGGLAGYEYIAAIHRPVSKLTLRPVCILNIGCVFLSWIKAGL